VKKISIFFTFALKFLPFGQLENSSICIVYTTQCQQNHSAAGSPAAANEELSWKVPKAIFASRHYPVPSSFLLEEKKSPCSLEGKSNVTATNAVDYFN
jgi:hypothetical protein